MDNQQVTEREAELSDQFDTVLSTPEPFQRWLESKGEDDLVGYTRIEDCCPIAMFLTDQGIPHPSVNKEEVKVYLSALSYDDLRTTGSRYFPLPKWAQRFVCKVDAVTDLLASCSRRVSRNEALDVLASVMTPAQS